MLIQNKTLICTDVNDDEWKIVGLTSDTVVLKPLEGVPAEYMISRKMFDRRYWMDEPLNMQTILGENKCSC